MTIDVVITGRVYNAYGQQITGAQTVETQFGYSLISSGLATAATAGQYPQPNNTPFDASGATVYLSANETIDVKTISNFLGRTLVCTTAITITISAPGLSCIIVAPPTGSVSLVPAGAVTLNGATTTLTRSLASNAIGFSIQPLAGTNLLVGGS